MTQAFTFRNGQLHIWTGSHTASGSALGYVEGVNLALNWGWQNDPSLSGTYRDHASGLRADLGFSKVHIFDPRLHILANLATAVHAKLTQSHILGSAGIVLYSGRIDQLAFRETPGQADTLSLASHFNIWSAF